METVTGLPNDAPFRGCLTSSTPLRGLRARLALLVVFEMDYWKWIAILDNLVAKIDIAYGWEVVFK